MPSSESLMFVDAVLRLAIRYDMTDDLLWSIKDDEIQVAAICSDAFWWATADAEKITLETLPELEQAFVDTEAACTAGEVYAGMLYAARRRKMRPQGAAYPEERELWPLFDACGPERPIDKGGFGNPWTAEQWDAKRQKKKVKVE